MSTWDVEIKEGKEFEAREVPPDGAIPARVCAMIDVGTHDARNMKGEVYERRTLILGYELGELDSSGKPFHMAQMINLSMDVRSNLYAIVKALHGEPKLGDKLDPAWLDAKPCLLQISHDVKVKKGKERTYANIDSVGKPPRGTICPPGTCVVWRVADLASRPLPDVSQLPAVWHDGLSKMLTVAEWVANSKEVYKSGQIVMQTPAGSTRPQPMTQAEADAINDEPPF
jgi:hypothetical protein